MFHPLLHRSLVVMASPSKPSPPFPVNPDPPSSLMADVETKVNAPSKFLPVLMWTKSAFGQLITNIQMSTAYGAMYPQEGDTAGDAPAGYISMFADWFVICNLWLPLMVFMVDLLEYYNIHIFQLSPLGMIRARHIEYTFRAQNVVPLVEDFRHFYQMRRCLVSFLSVCGMVLPSL
ncbi:hypothetical protein Hanom_Chr15g01405781 [Helianthus anomalus]